MIRLFKSQKLIIVQAQLLQWLLISGEGFPANVFLRSDRRFADFRPGRSGCVSGEPEFMNSKRIRIAKNDTHIMHTAYIMEPDDKTFRDRLATLLVAVKSIICRRITLYHDFVHVNVR